MIKPAVVHGRIWRVKYKKVSFMNIERQIKSIASLTIADDLGVSWTDFLKCLQAIFERIPVPSFKKVLGGPLGRLERLRGMTRSGYTHARRRYQSRECDRSLWLL
jgi:hypothetical protein